jgi:hypothetical protein
VPSTVSAGHYISQNVTEIAVGRRYTYSAVVKPSGYSSCSLNLGASRFYANFNLSTGVVTSVAANGTDWANGSASITALADGYFRCQMTGDCLVASSVTNGARIGVNQAAAHSGTTSQGFIGDGVSGLEVLLSQIEIGPVVTTYQRVGAAFEARRNLILRSEEFDNAYWLKTNTSVIANAAVAPDGSLSADKLIENTSLASHNMRPTISNLSAGVYTFSVYAKAAERTHVGFTLAGASSRAGVSFNLSTGTVRSTRFTGSFTGGVASMQAVGNGWYRCQLSFTAGVVVSNTSNFIQTDDGVTALGDIGMVYTGDGVSGVLIWGFQLEEGSLATNYQRVGTSAFDITEQGVPTTHYLQFDGIDDSLQMSPFTMNGTVAMGISQVAPLAFVRTLLNSSTIGLIVTTNDNTWALRRTSDGSVIINSSVSSLTPNVLVFQVTQNDMKLWVGGAFIGADAATNAFGTITQLFPNNGTFRIHGLVVLDRALTEPERRQTEKLIAKKTSLVTLPSWLSDLDAAAYIAAVTAADGQALPFSVQVAINNFVIGCKGDGIWNAIKAACFLSGPRTLTGALIPLVGAAPTNFNFVSGDYVAKTGLKGNGTTKRLGSGRANTVDPQNNKHASAFVSDWTTPIPDGQCLIGNGGAVNGVTQLLFSSANDRMFPRIHQATEGVATGTLPTTGLSGASRSNASDVQWINGTLSGTILSNSTTQEPGEIVVFGRGTPASPLVLTNARLAWYSIGENLSLSQLDARLTTYMAAITAATY